jgi:hypothetical protein
MSYRSVLNTCKHKTRSAKGISKQYHISLEKSQALLNRGINEGHLQLYNNVYSHKKIISPYAERLK